MVFYRYVRKSYMKLSDFDSFEHKRKEFTDKPVKKGWKDDSAT